MHFSGFYTAHARESSAHAIYRRLRLRCVDVSLVCRCTRVPGVCVCVCVPHVQLCRCVSLVCRCVPGVCVILMCSYVGVCPWGHSIISGSSSDLDALRMNVT